MAAIKIGGRELEIRDLVLDDGPGFDAVLSALTASMEAEGAQLTQIAGHIADVVQFFVGHNDGVSREWLGKNLPLNHARLRAILDACLETLGMVKAAPKGEAQSP